MQDTIKGIELINFNEPRGARSVYLASYPFLIPSESINRATNLFKVRWEFKIMTMAKKKKVLSNADQQNLGFNTTIACEIANAVNESMKHCKKLSREQIAIKVFCFITSSNELKQVLLTDYEVLAICKNKKYLALTKKMSFSGTVERW